MSGARIAVALAVWVGVAVPAATLGTEDDRPTAWTARVQPLDTVERITMPPVDEAALRAEDDRRLAETGELSLRYAVNLPVDVTPDSAGTWERLDDGALLWRLRVFSDHARSLNFGFDRYSMPRGGRLFIYSADGTHVYRPFTADDNERHGQLWTPPVFGDETVLELTLPEGARSGLKLHLAFVNHDYRGFGRPGMEKAAGCEVDVVCPVGVAYDDQDRAVSVISLGGGRLCSGSLINNTAGDRRPYFITAQHCGVTAANASSLVAFWNFFNSKCRPQGQAPHGLGDGSLAQFNTGSFFHAENTSTDLTLVELDDPLAPSFNLFLAGWDRTPMPVQFTSTAGIHHPRTQEMRISLAPGSTFDEGWGGPPDGTHIRTFWGANLGTIEPGSSGSPLYTAQGRFIGQLHGGNAGCGIATFTGVYGRFSQSWAAAGLGALLDPAGSGQITLDGLNGCAQAATPGGVTATATAPNTIRIAWSAVAGASGYNVYRAEGTCPQAAYSQIAANVAATVYDDATVSGGTSYSYVVRSVAPDGCRSGSSACAGAAATGACTLSPTFAGARPVTQPAPGECRLDLSWTAGTANCAGPLKYNVYRSTDPAFVPGPSNLRQSCVDGTSFQDTTVTAGSVFYYVVRAEDATVTGAGPCNGGNEDANLVRRSGNPDAVNVFSDDTEAGPGLWVVDNPGPGNPWAVVGPDAASPSRSWFVNDPAQVTDQRLAFANAVTVPPAATLSFTHQYDLEGTIAAPYDGGVLEYSLDGTNWFDILAGDGGTIPPNPARITAHPYRAVLRCCSNPLSNRLAWTALAAWVETRVDLADFAAASIRLRWRRGTDLSVPSIGWWLDDVRLSGQQACGAPLSLTAESLAVDPSGNGVLQPNEPAVVVEPTWRNPSPLAVASVAGGLDTFTGPAGATYAIDDASAAYGTIAPGGSASCLSNCYAVTVGATSRPILHWDASARETLSNGQPGRTWTLHVGDSFTDVLPASPFYRFVETILHEGVTGGCAATTYCPAFTTTRDQMAVFVLVSKEGSGYAPPACVAGSEAFADVPASSPYCRWIEELARRGVVSGCGGGDYCPTAPASREQMAVFVLRTLDPTLAPPACVAGSEMFADVPATSPFCRWIEELARRGVVTGCGGGNYCPTAAVTREQMSVFLAVTFGLTLYGV